jgi:hypothetical protein
MKAEQYHDEFTTVEGIAVRITTYHIGEDYYCHIANADPGATIARAGGRSAEEARRKAWHKAVERLEKEAHNSTHP